jgi:CubicO group peptidase (beta-lactamase class C family)
MNTQGNCAPQFERVKEIFQRNLDSGEDLGASVALIVDGEMVIDLWGGYTDEAKTTPWKEDTIVPVYSTSKTMVALCALILIDRGLIDPFAPVATYWPEFAANGKENIQVRHVMSHTSGLSGWEQPVTVDDVYDWERATEILAAQAPWWEAGTASGYHLVSYNHLVGEIVRRVSGMTPVEFFNQEIGIPFGLDYQFGVSDSIEHRVSPMVPIKEAPLDMGAIDPEGVAAKTFTGPFFADSVGQPHFLAFPLTMNGIANARSIATAQAVVSHGGEFRGRRLLKQSTIDLIFEQQSNGIDLVLGMPMEFGIGYAMPSTDWAIIPRGRSCWWAGWGGSRVVNMMEHRATFAYAMNTMKQGVLGDPRSFDMFNAVVEVLES